MVSSQKQPSLLFLAYVLLMLMQEMPCLASSGSPSQVALACASSQIRDEGLEALLKARVDNFHTIQLDMQDTKCGLKCFTQLHEELKQKQQSAPRSLNQNRISSGNSISHHHDLAVQSRGQCSCWAD